MPTVYTEEQAKELELRYKDITDGGKEVHNLLLESNKVLRQSKGAPAWRAYVEFINNILIQVSTLPLTRTRTRTLTLRLSLNPNPEP